MEITSYQKYDKLQGILIHFLTYSQNQFELWIKPKQIMGNFHLQKGKLDVEIGNEFDAKELLFKNLFNAIGPKSDLQVIYTVYNVTEEKKNCR